LRMKFIATAVLFAGIWYSTYAGNENGSPGYPYIIEHANKMDQLEETSRKIFYFNSIISDYVQKPMAVTWASVMPEYGIKGVNRFFNNLEYPKRLINSLLQADFSSSGSESLRFLLNTTVGIAGLYDPAKSWFKISPRQKDFGQTLAGWGVDEGSYVTLPLAGGNSVRGGVGSVVDLAFNPLTYVPFAYAKAAVTGTKIANVNADFYNELDMLNKTFADPYAIHKMYFYSRRTFTLKKFDDSNNNLSTLRGLYHDELAKVPQFVGKKHPDEDLADLKIAAYQGQSPEIDTFRYLKFTISNEEESIWDDMSLWNHEFKNIKQIGKISIASGNKYKLPYAYWLQSDEDAPTAYIIHGVGSGVHGSELNTLAKLLFDQKYSVVVLPSILNWEFVRAAAENWLPGYLPEDVKMIDKVMRLVSEDLHKKKDTKPAWNILLGVSLGGMHTVKLAEIDQQCKKPLFKQYIAVNPPVDLIYGMKIFDNYCKVWTGFEPMEQLNIAALLNAKYNMLAMRLHAPLSRKAKVRKAVAAKQLRASKMYGGEVPFVQSEAEALLSLKAKQVTIELFYSIYKHKNKLLPLNLQRKYNEKELYREIVKFEFADYAEKVLVPFYKNKFGSDFTIKNLKEAANLTSREAALRDNSKLFVLHTADDIFLSRKHKLWLKRAMNERCVIFDHGGHLGEMYTEVFQDKLKEIVIKL
jgi:ABC-type transporter lipoprotein component MlaA/pimeloyl-ACP methyl ester carboxylesterase